MLRWPVRVPVRTSFGTMHDRPAVLVRVEDAEGAHGWGEAWCNFPSCGAEHRARLIETVLAPLLVGRALRLARGGVRRADARRPRCWRSSRASRGRSRRRSPASTSPCTTWRRAARGLPLWRHLLARRAATARRRGRRAGLRQRHQPRAARRRRSRRCAPPATPRSSSRSASAPSATSPTSPRCAPPPAPRRRVMVDANQAWDLAGAIAMARRARRVRRRPGSRSRCAPTGRGTSGSASPPRRRSRSPPARTRSATRPSTR